MRFSYAVTLAAGLIVMTAGQIQARETIVTGPHGRTASRTVNHSNAGNGTLSRSVDTTGFNGRTRSKDFTQTNNGNGTVTDNRTVTGFNGGTRTTTVTRPN